MVWTFCIITYFKLRVNQNPISEACKQLTIITYFKLRVNQNVYVALGLYSPIITYFKLRVNQNVFMYISPNSIFICANFAEIFEIFSAFVSKK